MDRMGGRAWQRVKPKGRQRPYKGLENTSYLLYAIASQRIIAKCLMVNCPALAYPTTLFLVPASDTFPSHAEGKSLFGVT
jgi:hypothetical protein